VHVSLGERGQNRSITYLSDNGADWEGPFGIGDNGYRLWRTRRGVGCSIAYYCAEWDNKEDALRLYTTRDGKIHRMLVDHPFSANNRANEFDMVFTPDDTAYCLLRQDKQGEGKMSPTQIGTARPPCTKWTWKEIPHTLRGPAITLVPDGRLLAIVGRYEKERPSPQWTPQHTELGWVDLEARRYAPAPDSPPAATVPTLGRSGTGVCYG